MIKKSGEKNMIPYALFNSKIIFEPFQYKPFFEFFEKTDKDLYIADEVGVGKTTVFVDGEKSFVLFKDYTERIIVLLREEFGLR